MDDHLKDVHAGTYLVANSTPIVLLLSKLNSLRVNLDSKLLLPTPESPINTTAKHKNKCRLHISCHISPQVFYFYR